MNFIFGSPASSCVNDLDNFDRFLMHGQRELKDFLKNLLGLEKVRLQFGDIKVLKTWLKTSDLKEIIEVPGKDDEICVVSQIQEKGKLIAQFPYVLKGRDVKKYYASKSFLPKIAQAVSDQISLCYSQEFRGGDWMFGESLAKIIVSNCISSNKYDSVKFMHLIEKMEQLASSTFEGSFFSTGAIVCENISKYKNNYFEFKCKKGEEKFIDKIDKRQWFLANGQKSFILLDTNFIAKGIYLKNNPIKEDFIGKYFEEYYLENDLVSPDFIVRTVGPNEISVSDHDGKEFVRIENVWRYRHQKNITELLGEKLGIDYKLRYAILYYTLKCSRERVSSIIWLPNDCRVKAIKTLTTNNRVKMWNKQLNILNENHLVLMEKILASDGAIVVNKKGQVLYESVFADMSKKPKKSSKKKETKRELVGSGETAAELLANNGVAIKISQDGTIKIYSDEEKYYY